MFLIDTDEEAATGLIAALVLHLPLGMTLGHVHVVTPTRVLATGTDADGPALWDIPPDDCARRLLGLAAGESEETVFRCGIEVERRLIAA